jgi:hypothetical protein
MCQSVTYQETSGHKYVMEDVGVLDVSSCLYLHHGRAMAMYNKELKLLPQLFSNDRVSCLAVSNKQCAEEL